MDEKETNTSASMGRIIPLGSVGTVKRYPVEGRQGPSKQHVKLTQQKQVSIDQNKTKQNTYKEQEQNFLLMYRVFFTLNDCMSSTFAHLKCLRSNKLMSFK